MEPDTVLPLFGIAKGNQRAVRQHLRLVANGTSRGANDAVLTQVYFEVVLAQRVRILHRQPRGTVERPAVWSFTDKTRLSSPHSPRSGGHTAEGDRGRLHDAVPDVQSGRDRHQREGVAVPVTDLEVPRRFAKVGRGQLDSRDQLARAQYVVEVR